MLHFWQNPEFVRHRRAELRPSRSLAIVAVVIVVCLLVGLVCWISHQSELQVARNMAAQFDGRWNQRLVEMESRGRTDFWRSFFAALVLIQAAVLTFWSLLSCAQSVSGERERKTWDFQRVTRLNAAELLVGKVLGEPVVAYFIVLCALPITVAAGLLGEFAPGTVVSVYVLVLAAALFLGLAGLWISSLFESRSRGIGLIGALGLFAFVAASYGFSETYFSGLGGFSPLTALLPLLGLTKTPGTVACIFGIQVGWVAMSLLLYVTFGAWLVLMTLQNLKRDYEDMRPLTRWQTVACAAFLNFVLYALFYPWAAPTLTAQDLVTTMVGINGFVLFAVGLASLSPHEQLKGWWRKRLMRQPSLFSADGPPWPWVVISGLVIYLLLVCGLFTWRNLLPFKNTLFGFAALQSLIMCVFMTRDVLFIQWCRTTRLRSPMVKGFLYLCLYYAASSIAVGALAIRSEVQSRRMMNALTPAAALVGEQGLSWRGSIALGIALQLMVIGFLSHAITSRLQPSSTPQTASGD